MMDPNPSDRLDQKLKTESEEFIQRLLDEFPDLRAVAVVFDYELSNLAGLPPGVWMPRRPLRPSEALVICKQIDTLSAFIRRQHDEAATRAIGELQAKIKELAEKLKEETNGESEVEV